MSLEVGQVVAGSRSSIGSGTRDAANEHARTVISPDNVLMHAARRLVISVDLAAAEGPQADTDQRMSVSALLELELVDGRRVVLLNDRGWAACGRDIWAHIDLQDLAETSRMVVGPDEPPEGVSRQEEAAMHWAQLASRARANGVDVQGDDLAAMPHDVDISSELRERVARGQR